MFAKSLRKAMTEAPNIEILFGFWEQNVATVRALSYTLKQKGVTHLDFAKSLVDHLKSCATALVKLTFAIPLCALHHSENHTTGNERRWWVERRIDPLTVAQGLWMRSKGRDSTTLSTDDTNQTRPGVET